MSKIKKLVRNKGFWNQLKKAARFTSRTGFESSFLVLKKKNRIISELFRGNSEGVMPVHFLKHGLSKEGDVHFHSFAGPVIMPSENDLRLLVWTFDEKSFNRPNYKWIIIAQVQGKKIFLLYIEPIHRIAESEILSWEEETCDVSEIVFQKDLQKQVQKEINYKLAFYGFRTEFEIISL